jgi:NAD(P)-dependent dehydrogenase (short-subunit alcohol dehydrogenase family)
MVTGAGSGIGRAICERLARDGARLAALDVSREAAAQTIVGLDTDCIALAADVRDPVAMGQAIERLIAHFGQLDMAVNAAGVGASQWMVDTPIEVWERVVDVCLKGVFVSTQAQARQMIEQGRGGVVVNLASTNAVQPGEGLSAYCAAKAGVEMFSQVCALELADKGIRVACVGPGLTDTPMVARLLGNPRARAAFLDNIPLKRPAQPQDIAAAVAFLVSDEAAYITGQTLYVDGGASLMRYPDLASRQPSNAASVVAEPT